MRQVGGRGEGYRDWLCSLFLILLVLPGRFLFTSFGGVLFGRLSAVFLLVFTLLVLGLFCGW